MTPRYYYPVQALSEKEELAFDICVYGATACGIATAVQAAKSGKMAVIVEFGKHVGGMTTGGLGATDRGSEHVVDRLARRFCEDIWLLYGGHGELALRAENCRTGLERLCITRSKNKVPFPKPNKYDPERYELLRRHIDSGVYDIFNLALPCRTTSMTTTTEAQSTPTTSARTMDALAAITDSGSGFSRTMSIIKKACSGSSRTTPVCPEK